MTIESGQFTRWTVLGALSLAAALMFAVSIRGNYLYGYSLGQAPEKRQLFAWANVAADVWKAFGLIAVSVLWRTQRRRAACLASLAWLACLLFGLNSALGIYLHDRTLLTRTREARHATYTEVQRELASVEEKLRTLPQHRSVREIEAAINARLGQPVMTGERVRGTIAAVSVGCTKIDTRSSDACKEIAQRRQELATATEGNALEARASDLRERIVILRERGGSLAPDPLGEFYAWMTRGFVHVRDVGFGFPLFFALLIEVVSALGPITIAAYAEATRTMNGTGRNGVLLEPAIARRGALRQATASTVIAPQAGAIVSWIGERAVPTSDNSAIGAEELHRDYVHWCKRSGLRALSISEFVAEFDHLRELPDLAGKIRKFGERYYGIALVEV